MSIQLTAGSCQRLQYAAPTDEEIFDAPHTVQFLSIKKVNANPAAVDRYRIIISDGIHFVQAMLATQLNGMVQDNTIGKNTVVVIEKATCNYVQIKRLIIVLSLRVLAHSAEKIGDPKQLDPEPNQSNQTPATESTVATPLASSSNTAVQKPMETTSRPQASAQRGRVSVYPIEGLSPYQNNWTIKARVIQKSEMKTWSNQRGEGKLFNVTLMDDTGEIRGTAFNIVADELYPKLEEGKVYYISKARVNLAKKKFSNLTNDYELNFERSTEVEECNETSNVPTIKYNFIPLNALKELPKDSICDVIGIVQEALPLGEITSKTTNRQIPKRELKLVDKSISSVKITLWGKQAEQYHAEDHVVIAFKGVKVGDYGGVSLSMFSSSTLQINPDIEECFALRGWWDTEGSQQTFSSQTAAGNFLSVEFNRTEIRSLDEVKQVGYGLPNQPEHFSTRATIMHIKSDSISYPACPNQGCNKKVTLQNDGWRCERCDASHGTPEHRYIMSMAVADYSGQAWLQGFNDVGSMIFGMSANELVEIKDRDSAQYNVIMHRANCNAYNFSCRAKQDTYNETTRIRYGISRIYRLDYKEEAMLLRDLLYSSWAR